MNIAIRLLGSSTDRYPRLRSLSDTHLKCAGLALKCQALPYLLIPLPMNTILDVSRSQ